MKKLSLIEWVAQNEKQPYDWAEQFLPGLLKQKYHTGDCTKENYTCGLCALETTLREYYEYVFDK